MAPVAEDTRRMKPPKRWTCGKCTYTHDGPEAELTSCTLCSAPRPSQTRSRSSTPGRPPPPLRGMEPMLPASGQRKPGGGSDAAPAPCSQIGAKAPLRVRILGARGLRARRRGPASEPFCVCEIPLKPGSKISTPVLSNTLDPVWNFEADIPNYAIGDSLNFTVYDQDHSGFGEQDIVLGVARLTHSEFHAAGFSGELPLSGVGSSSGFLTVQVAQALAAPAQRGGLLGMDSPAPAPGSQVSIPEPQPSAIRMQDPRSSFGRDVGVIAFHYPGRPEAWDELCGAGFLSGSFDVGRGGMELEAPCEPGRRRTFCNSEAAFQALKFWPVAGDFEGLSGEEASRRAQQLSGREDWSYAGFLNEWRGMSSVLSRKFQPNSPMAAALLKTRDAFLLEHHSAVGRNNVWSDNGNGEGKNWLGLQLMVIRDRLARSPSWTGYLESLLDLASGQPLSRTTATQWQDVVRRATRAVVDEFNRPPATTAGVGGTGVIAPAQQWPQAQLPSVPSWGNTGQGTATQAQLSPTPSWGNTSLAIPSHPSKAGNQWASALNFLVAEKRQQYGHPFSICNSPCPSQSGTSTKASLWSQESGSSQWSTALSSLKGNWQPQANAYGMSGKLSAMALQWGNALGLLAHQQWKPQSYPFGVPSQAFMDAQEQQWKYGQQPQPVFSAPPINPFSGGGMNQKWPYALSLMEQKWSYDWQPQVGNGGWSSQFPSQQLPTDALALLPEATCTPPSDSLSFGSQTSSELQLVVHARSLYRACQDGNASEADRILRAGLASPDCRNPKGSTPLFAAAFGNHAAVVRLLLTAQADPDRANNDSATPAFIAAQKNCTAALELLLQAKSDPDRSRKDRATPTFIAAANGSTAALELLLRASAEPNLANKNGDTPLTIASYASNAEAVERLVRARANVNAPGYQGEETALDCAYRAQAHATSPEVRVKAEIIIEALVMAGARPRADLC